MKLFSEIIKRNLALKIFALILAILLWAYVQLVQNPEISYHILEVPITITGEADINSEGYVISSIPKNLKTNITISAKRSKINNIDNSDITAFVDVSTSKSVGDFSFPVKVRSNDGEITISTKNPSAVTLYVDRIITVQKPIKISYDGVLDKDYYIDKDNVSISPPIATIKTPELLSPKINEILVHIDMTNVKAEIHNEFKGIPIDSQGEAVKSKFINQTNENIIVKVPLLKRKIVPIVIKNPPENYHFNLNQEQIEIAGEAPLVDKLEYIEGYIKDYTPTDIKSSYNVTLKLGNFVHIDKKDITAYTIKKD
jgi:YbbR domain-containing protein